MEMFFLVMKLGFGVVVIPDRYTKDECETAGRAHEHVCIQAPMPDGYYNCAISVPDPTNPGRGTTTKSHCEPNTGQTK